MRVTKVLFPNVTSSGRVASLHHTLGHIDCPVCEKARTMTLCRLTGDLPFSEAADLWLNARSIANVPGAVSRRYIKANTERSYRQYLSNLKLFFGEMRLDQIDMGNLVGYQDVRLSGSPPFVRKRRPNKNEPEAPCPAGPRKINYELALLIKIMKRSKCWDDEMDETYEPLLVEVSEMTIALTPEERRHWLDVASLKPDWNVVLWYSMLAFGTSMGTNEMRSLRLGDVNLFHRTVSVPPEGAKNRARARTIPLVTGEAIWACEQLIERAKDLGASSPIHYLFPSRDVPFPHDPTRPMSESGIRKPWDEVRTVSGLKKFTPYHTRHTALTHWAEGGMRIEEMMALAGHMSPRMTRHYARISEGALRIALETAARRKGPESEYGPSYQRRMRA